MKNVASVEQKKRREFIKMLKTERSIACMDHASYLALLALKIEIGACDITVPLAELEKAWEVAA